MAISFGVLPPSIESLLPPNPSDFLAKQDASRLAMEYRYWITEEEIEKLDYIVQLLNRLKEALVTEVGPHKYFEEVGLGVPNWSTFLQLLQAQLRLQIAIRDYLLTLNSNASMENIRSLADKIKQCVEEVRELGDSAHHVD